MGDMAPYRKSGFFNNKVVNPLMAALGLAPALTVRGRTSGRRYTMPVLPLDYEGKRYLVAPRGNTHWARNLRAVGQCGLRVGGRNGRFIAREIPVAERGPAGRRICSEIRAEVRRIRRQGIRRPAGSGRPSRLPGRTGTGETV